MRSKWRPPQLDNRLKNDYSDSTNLRGFIRKIEDGILTFSFLSLDRSFFDRIIWVKEKEFVLASTLK